MKQYGSDRLHQRAKQTEHLRGAFPFSAMLPAEGVDRHECEASRYKPRGAGFDKCFCASGHSNISFLKVYASILCKNPANNRKCPEENTAMAPITVAFFMLELNFPGGFGAKISDFVLFA